MPILLLILGVGVFVYMWMSKRGSTLTPDCRWREHRSEGVWRCAACGAECPPPAKGEPRQCLRAQA